MFSSLNHPDGDEGRLREAPGHRRPREDRPAAHVCAHARQAQGLRHRGPQEDQVQVPRAPEGKSPLCEATFDLQTALRDTTYSHNPTMTAWLAVDSFLLAVWAEKPSLPLAAVCFPSPYMMLQLFLHTAARPVCFRAAGVIEKKTLTTRSNPDMSSTFS